MKVTSSRAMRRDGRMTCTCDWDYCWENREDPGTRRGKAVPPLLLWMHIPWHRTILARLVLSIIINIMFLKDAICSQKQVNAIAL